MGLIGTNIIVGLSSLLFGYLLGSFPTGVFIGKVFFGKDPRDYGSHNTGGTNTGRVLGKKIGVLTILIDALKAAIAIYVVWAILSFTGLNQYMVWENGYNAAPVYYWGAGLAAAIGHCHSIFLKFKGGKAVACEVGTVVMLSWLELVLCIISFFTTLKTTKYVSISSIVMSIVATITLWVLAIIRLTTGFDVMLFSWGFSANAANGVGLPILGFEAAVAVTIITVMLIVRHRDNFRRLKEGTETKISWMK